MPYLELISRGSCRRGVPNCDSIVRGYSGFSGTPGHEFVGEVIEADNARLAGRRVVGEIKRSMHTATTSICTAGIKRNCELPGLQACKPSLLRKDFLKQPTTGSWKRQVPGPDYVKPSR